MWANKKARFYKFPLVLLLNLQKPNNEKPISMTIHTIKKTQMLLMQIARFILREEALIERQSKTKHADIPVRSWIDICTNAYCTSLPVRQKCSSGIWRSWKSNANTWQKQIQTLMLVFTDWTFTIWKIKFLDLLLKVLTTWGKKRFLC